MMIQLRPTNDAIAYENVEADVVVVDDASSTLLLLLEAHFEPTGSNGDDDAHLHVTCQDAAVVALKLLNSHYSLTSWKQAKYKKSQSQSKIKKLLNRDLSCHLSLSRSHHPPLPMQPT